MHGAGGAANIWVSDKVSTTYRGGSATHSSSGKVDPHQHSVYKLKKHSSDI